MALPEKEPGKLIAGIFVIIFLVTYSIDYLNGKTHFSRRQIIQFTDLNIGTSAIRDLAISIRDFNVDAPKPQTLTEESITFKTFKNDSVKNQFLIIVESWGLPVDSVNWRRLQKILEVKAQSAGWKAIFGYSSFKGGTVHAELRELLNVSGDYHYLLNSGNARSMRSIFSIKKSQGYSTLAIHSFSNEMFHRGIWWENIGIDSAYFLESVVHKDGISRKQMNYSSPFPSLNDEYSFLFINERNKESKKFGYFLTVNSHLPFTPSISDSKKIVDFKDQLSIDGHNQLNRILELLHFFITEMNNGKWDKVLMVGDHMPPFSNGKDRGFYSTNRVPYVILQK